MGYNMLMISSRQALVALVIVFVFMVGACGKPVEQGQAEYGARLAAVVGSNGSVTTRPAINDLYDSDDSGDYSTGPEDSDLDFSLDRSVWHVGARVEWKDAPSKSVLMAVVKEAEAINAAQPEWNQRVFVSYTEPLPGRGTLRYNVLNETEVHKVTLAREAIGRNSYWDAVELKPSALVLNETLLLFEGAELDVATQLEVYANVSTDVVRHEQWRIVMSPSAGETSYFFLPAGLLKPSEVISLSEAVKGKGEFTGVESWNGHLILNVQTDDPNAWMPGFIEEHKDVLPQSGLGFGFSRGIVGYRTCFGGKPAPELEKLQQRYSNC